MAMALEERLERERRKQLHRNQASTDATRGSVYAMGSNGPPQPLWLGTSPMGAVMADPLAAVRAASAAITRGPSSKRLVQSGSSASLTSPCTVGSAAPTVSPICPSPSPQRMPGWSNGAWQRTGASSTPGRIGAMRRLSAAAGVEHSPTPSMDWSPPSASQKRAVTSLSPASPFLSPATGSSPRASPRRSRPVVANPNVPSPPTLEQPVWRLGRTWDPRNTPPWEGEGNSPARDASPRRSR